MNLKPFSIAALAAFLATIVIGDVAGDEYHPLAEPVSRYVNTSAGWVTSLGLFLLAAGTALTAWQVKSTARTTLTIAAAAAAIAAIFPADPPGRWSDPSLADTVHGLAALVAFAGLTISALLLARRGDIGFSKTLAWVAVGATAVMLVTMVDVMTVRALGAGGLTTLFGLTERIAILAHVTWMIAVVAAKPRGGRDALAV